MKKVEFAISLAIVMGLGSNGARGANQLPVLSSGTASSPIPGAEHVVVVDIDGCRKDALYSLLLKNPERVPNMSEIFRGAGGGDGGPSEGQFVGVRNAVTVFPSYTYACQASFFTGYWPASHGILGNEYYDREQESRFGFSGGSIIDPKDVVQVYEYDTFYDARQPGAGASGLAGLCDWVTEDIEDPKHRAWGGLANRQLLVPTVYDMASRGGLKSLVAFNMISSAGYRDDPNITWVKPTPDDFCIYELGNAWDYDAAMAHAFVEALREADEMPALMTTYFAGHDHYAHGFDKSPDGTEKAQTWYLAEHVDRILAIVMDELKAQGIYDQTVFLFSTDHGHTDVIANDYHSIVMDSELEESIEDYDCGIFGRGCFDVMDYWDWLFSDDYSAYVALNSGAAHVYLRNRQSDRWMDPPSTEDLRGVADALSQYHYNRSTEGNDATPGMDEAAEGPYPSKKVELILVRDASTCDSGWKTPYQVFVSRSEAFVDLAIWLDENPDYYQYIEPLIRIENMNCIRSGDIVFIPTQMENNRWSTWYADGEIESTHGSLYPGDSYIPFALGGTPLAGTQKVVPRAFLVDASPTIAHILGFDPGSMEGRSILD